MNAAQPLTADQPAGRHGATGGGSDRGGCADEPAARELTDREQQVLAFERRWWRRAGAKERAIRELFELSPARYYQLLNSLADEPAAARADPALVQRLRRVRAGRQRVRDAHQLRGEQPCEERRQRTDWQGIEQGIEWR